MTRKKINDQRLINEIKHGEYIYRKGERIWCWSSPAGIERKKRRAKILTDFIGNRKKRVLEIGCGTGLFTKEISKTKNQIFAIDISPDLLNLAKRRINNKNVCLQLQNAYQTKYENSFFDFIVGVSVLHHLSIDRALKELHRILKENGKFLFFEPNMLNPQVFIERNFPFARKLFNNSPDETAFFRWQIKKKLLKTGFTNVNVKNFDFLHPAIPEFLFPLIKPTVNFLEKLPLIREVSGSLIILGKK